MFVTLHERRRRGRDAAPVRESCRTIAEEPIVPRSPQEMVPDAKNLLLAGRIRPNGQHIALHHGRCSCSSPTSRVS